MKPKTRSIVLLCLCAAALLGLVALAAFVGIEVANLSRINTNQSDDALPGVGILAFLFSLMALVFFYDLGALLIALFGWFVSLVGIKTAPSSPLKGAFTAFMVIFSIQVLFFGGILVITILM